MIKTAAGLLALLLIACRPCAASTEQWVEVHSSHFTVITNDGEKQGRHILDQFERMRWVFHTMFPSMNTDPANTIQVFALKNQKSFEALEPAAYLAKGQLKLAGYFLRTQDKNYVLLRLDAEQEQHPYAIVYHEYTHLQLSGASEWIPLWLNEGLAQFFQNTDIRNKDVHLGQPSAEDLYLLRQSRFIPLPVLFKIDASSPYYHQEDKGSIFYAESWALTHMLEVNDRMNNTQHLRDYAVLLANHEDSLVAAEKAFGDVKKLQSALESYIQSAQYREFILNSAAAPIDESSYTTRVLSPTDADAARADVLASVGRLQDAHSLLDAVLKADPNNVPAHETMGMLALRDHDETEALKWYADAVKLDSKSCLAQYYFAEISMLHGGSSDDAAIESSLRKAIELNPSFAPAYNQLAMFYGTRRLHLDEAQKLIVKAVNLDPSQLAYRMNAASVLATAGDYAGAQKVLSACLKLARNPSEVATVQGRIEQMQQIRDSMAENARMQTVVTAQSESAAPRAVEVVKEAAPKHPTEPPTGTKHFAEGTMRGVNCSYPSVLEFKVEGAKNTVSVYTNNYFKLELTALGFTPAGDMNPCSDFEGKKARVQYAESSDKTVDGQVIAVELRK
jgi:tetratricopeptide (TPR) repeat protein